MHRHAVVTPVVDRTDGDLGTWTSVATLGIGAFAIGPDMFVVAGVLGSLAGDLDVTVGAAGLTVTVFALAYASGAPLLSALLGRRRLRSVLIGSLVLFGLFNLTSAIAPSLVVLLGARALSALAASVYVPAAGASAVAAVSASQRGRALAVILGGSSMAMVLGAPLGVLLAAAYSWRAAFGLVAALAAVTALGLRRSSIGSVPLTHSTMRQRLQLVRSPAVAGLLGVTLLVMAGSNSMYTYLDALLGSAAGPGGLGLLIGVFGVGGMVGTWWGGAAADRWGSRPVVLSRRAC
ncbi:MAG: MFS transporter [Pseudonocardiaceae bacterium]